MCAVSSAHTPVNPAVLSVRASKKPADSMNRVLLNARQRAGRCAAPHRHRTAELKACR